MLARKCDRCGRLYEAKSANIDGERADAIAALMFYKEGSRWHEEKYDICPNCLEKLKNWLEKNQEELE